MSFISLHFAAMVVALFFLYYILPKKCQPYLLLLGSLYFYFRCSGRLLIVMVFASVVAFLYGKYHTKKGLPVIILLLLAPLVTLKFDDFVLRIAGINGNDNFFTSIALPLGISFYTLQLIGYCVDVYNGKYEPETNFLSFLLATCFFPQIVQGPIPRYNELKETLLVPHCFDKISIQEGLVKIAFGIFFKTVLADKAGVFVDVVFSPEVSLTGAFYLVAALLYTFQLYADFLSCVLLAQGVAALFGVHLSENFLQPYFATSIKDFWRRWHMSLSRWLRDYVYIPLGGNRKGKLRTKGNLILTFFVSGLWHGAGFKYIVWGLMHGFYQILGDITTGVRDRFFAAIHIPSGVRIACKRICTFILVMFAWIFFRANSLRDGLHAIYCIFFQFDITTVTDGSLLAPGLNVPEFIVLGIAIVLLMLYDYCGEKGKPVIVSLLKQKEFIQYVAIFFILLLACIFGTYGSSYDAGAFIYGGF